MIRAAALTLLIPIAATTGGRFHYSAESDNPGFYGRSVAGAPFRESGLEIIAGGIVSHHLLASREMAGLFMAVKKRETVRTIIIVSPDHYRRVVVPASTTLLPWKTPGGMVQADGELFASIPGEAGVVIDDDAVAGEHGVSSLAGFIGTILPGVKVLPLVVGAALSWDGARNMGRMLARRAGKGVMVLVSTDFVHDRPRPEAIRLDQASRRALNDPAESLSDRAIQGITCDCRKGILILFSFLAETGLTSARVLANTDSGRISGLDIPVTSYFFVLYGR